MRQEDLAERTFPPSSAEQLSMPSDQRLSRLLRRQRRRLPRRRCGNFGGAVAILLAVPAVYLLLTVVTGGGGDEGRHVFVASRHLLEDDGIVVTDNTA